MLQGNLSDVERQPMEGTPMEAGEGPRSPATAMIQRPTLMVA